MNYMNELPVHYNGDGTATLMGKTIMYGTAFEITVNVKDLQKYKRGLCIHKSFPYLTNEQHELLISGYNTQECEELLVGIDVLLKG